jgi:hypothetical protein
MAYRRGHLEIVARRWANRCFRPMRLLVNQLDVAGVWPPWNGHDGALSPSRKLLSLSSPASGNRNLPGGATLNAYAQRDHTS